MDERITINLFSLPDPLVQRNMVSPVFRLPPETLVVIFIHGARDYHCDNNHCTNFRIPCWVNVSYVCRYWRNVALECATLWTYHFIVSLRWTEELLARSKEAPLKIRVYFRHQRPESWWYSIVDTLLDHAERIQELSLYVPATVLPAKISSRASRLQDLEVTLACFKWSSVMTYWDIPSLRTLKLARCPLPWHSPNLRDLRVLSIRQTPHSSKQTLQEFIAVLGCMQNLMDLHLEDALAPAPGFLSSELDLSSKIRLPHLARLLVIDPLTTVVGLLSRIDVPLQAEVRLMFQPEDRTSMGDFVPISSLLAQRFSVFGDPSSAPILRSLTIVSDSYGAMFTFSAAERDCNTRSPLKLADWGCNIPLIAVVKLGWGRWVGGPKDRIISDICRSVPPTTVQSLHFVDPPYSPAFWRETLGHLVRLRYLKLSQGRMPDLASVLAVASDGSVDRYEQDPVAGNVCWPELEELELDRISFGARDSLSPAITRKSLFDALLTRKMSQGQVTMINCGDWN